jgi:hypothetical protein
MIYDVSTKVMYALWPNQANQFLTSGDRSLLKTAVGSEAVDLSSQEIVQAKGKAKFLTQ